MAAFDIPEPLGYAYKSPIRWQAMNLVNTQLPKAPNFVDGGATYNPAALLQVGGAGFQWNGPTVFAGTSATTWEDGSTCVWEDGSSATFGDGCLVTVELDCTIELFGGINVRSGGGIINVSNGGVIDFDAGGLITGSGAIASGATLSVANGGTLSVANGGTFSAASGSAVNAGSGSTVTASLGSTVNLGGTTTLTGGTNLNLSPARSWTRRNLRICGTTTTAHVGGDRSAEEIMGVSPAASRGPVVAFLNGSSRVTLLEIDNLPDGATITQVQMLTHGTSPIGSITDEAVYKIIRWIDDQTVEDMSAAVADSHTDVTWETDITQTLTVNAHSTIDRAYRYAVQIVHHQVDVEVAMFVWGVVATGTTAQLRP